MFHGLFSGGNLLTLKGTTKSLEEGYNMIKQALLNGTALQKFKEMLIGQCVAPDLAEKLCNPHTNLWDVLPIGKHKIELTSESDGLVSSINALAIANVLTELGAGRLKPTDKVNHGVGMVLKTHKGCYLKKGNVWAVLYCTDELKEDHFTALKSALKIDPKEVNEKPIESRIIDIVKPNL